MLAFCMKYYFSTDTYWAYRVERATFPRKLPSKIPYKDKPPLVLVSIGHGQRGES